jgi:hypothetical protein
MRKDATGRPQVGNKREELGVRPGYDIPVNAGIVSPRTGGMSTTPDDPARLPPFLRPPRFGIGGFGTLPVFVFDLTRLGSRLTYRPDPDPKKAQQHGFVEPNQSMTIDAYQVALAATQTDWMEVL